MDKKRYAGVVVKCKNKVLLCKRNNQGTLPGMWSIPCGKLEDGESIEEGAKREFLEETHIDISKADLRFSGMIPRQSRDGKKIKGIMYVYVLDVDEEITPDLENAIDGDEHTESGYFAFNEIDISKTGEYLYRLIEIVLN